MARTADCQVNKLQVSQKCEGKDARGCQTIHCSTADKNFPFKWQRLQYSMHFRALPAGSPLVSSRFLLALGLLVYIPPSWSVSSTNDNGFWKRKGNDLWKKVSALCFCASNVNGWDAASHPLIKEEPGSCSDGSVLSQLPIIQILQRAEDTTNRQKDRQTDRNLAQGCKTMRLITEQGELITNNLSSLFHITAFASPVSTLYIFLCKFIIQKWNKKVLSTY